MRKGSYHKSSRNNRKRIGVAALLTACFTMSLPACADKEALHTGAAAQADAPDIVSADRPATGTQTAAGQPGDPGQQPAQTNASRAQMEIDEETKNELTAELLEESGLDTSVMEFVHNTMGCTFDLPEGFVESEDVEGMYVTDRYPLDASTIYYVVMDQDTSLQLMTEETFRKQTKESLKQIYDEDVTVYVDAFERITIDDYPALRILCHYQLGSIKISQLEYAVNADKTYMITYSQTSDYDRMEEYGASAATIHVQ